MLTRREFEVYMLIVEHASDNFRIAERVGCSYATARRHVHHILRKLGFSNSLQMLCAYHKREMNF